MTARTLSLACALGFFAGLAACQDGVVAPDDGALAPEELVATAKKPPDGGDSPGVNAKLVLTEEATGYAWSDVDQDPDGHVLVDNKKKFVGETSHDPRTHELDPDITFVEETCVFDLADDFPDPLLRAGDEAGLTPYLSDPRTATVVVLWNDGRDATIKFWGDMDPGNLEGVSPPIKPQIFLQAGSSATRDWSDPPGAFTEVTLPVETVRVVFGTKMGGGSVTCDGNQTVVATFYHL